MRQIRESTSKNKFYAKDKKSQPTFNRFSVANSRSLFFRPKTSPIRPYRSLSGISDCGKSKSKNLLKMICVNSSVFRLILPSFQSLLHLMPTVQFRACRLMLFLSSRDFLGEGPSETVLSKVIGL